METNAKEVDSAQKKNPLEELSKEELIKRYKNLLTIAQKAKQAKDEANQQIKHLEKEVDDLRKQQNGIPVEESSNKKPKKSPDSESEKQLRHQITTMQEMLSTLTNQKLELTMEIDKLKKKNEGLGKQYQEMQTNFEKSLVKIDELETTAAGYQRQVNRLMQENEELIRDLDAQEKEHVVQDGPTSNADLQKRINKLEAVVKASNEEIDRLVRENKNKNEQMKELYGKFKNETGELNIQLKLVNETVRRKNDENEKLIENTTQLKKQKESLEVELTEVKKNFNCILKENKNLLESNVLLEEKIEMMDKQSESVFTNIENIKANNSELKELVNVITKEKEELLSKNESVTAENSELYSKLDEYKNLNKFLNERCSEIQLSTETCSQELNRLNLDWEQLVLDLKEYAFQFHIILQQVCDIFEECKSEDAPNVIKTINDFVSQSNENFMKSLSKTDPTKRSDDWSSSSLTGHVYSQLTYLKNVLTYIEEWKKNSDISNTDKKAEVNFLQSKTSQNVCKLCLQKLTGSDMSMSVDSLESSDKKESVEISLSEERAEEGLPSKGDSLEYDCNEPLVVKEQDCVKCATIQKSYEEINFSLQRLNSEHEIIVNEYTKAKDEIVTLSNELIEINKMFEDTCSKLDEKRKELQTACELRTQLCVQNAQALEKLQELSLQNEDLLSKLIEKDNLVICLKSDVNSFRDNNIQLNDNIDSLKLEINKKNEDVSETVELCDKSTNKICEMENVISEQKSCISVLQSNINEIQLKFEKSKEEQLEDTVVHDKNSERIKMLEVELAEKLNFTESLKQEVTNLENHHAKLQEELSEKQEQLKIALEQSCDKEKTINDMENKICEQNKIISDLHSNIEKIQVQFEKYREEQMIVAANEDDENIAKVKLLENEVFEKIKFIDTLQEDVKNLQSIHMKLETELSEKCKEVERVSELCGNKEKTNSESEKIICEQKKIINTLQSNIDDVQLQFEKLKMEQKTIADGVHNENMTRIKSLEDEISEKVKCIDNLHQNIEHLQSLHQKLEEELNVKCKEVEKTIELHNDRVSEINDMQNTISEQNKVIATLQTNINEIQLQFEKYKEDQMKISDGVNDEYTSKISSLENEISEKTKLIFNLQQDVEKLQNLHMKLEEELNGKCKEIEKFSELNENREKRINELENVICEQKNYINSLQSNMNEIQLQYENHNKECKIKEDESIKNFTAVLNEKTEKVKCLENEVSEKDKLISSLQYDLQNLQSYQIKLEEDWKERLRIANDGFDDRIRNLESMNDELVNVKNSSSEALRRLKSVSEELELVKKERDESLVKVTELIAVVTDVKSSLSLKEEELNLKSVELKKSKEEKENFNIKLQIISSNWKELRKNQFDISQSIKDMQSIFLKIIFDVLQNIKEKTNYLVDQFLQKAKLENSEMLSEMNEMIQVLKQRGEVISKLNEVNNEMEHKLNDTESKLVKALDECDSLSKELNEKTSVLKQLETSLTNLRETYEEVSSKEQKANETIHELQAKLQQRDDEAHKDGGEVQSEIMSTSTFSKAEDPARLKDLEDSFEERYTKLRVVAVKLKKRVSELTAALKEVETEKNSIIHEKDELQKKIVQLSAQAKTLQAIQQEYDSVQDKLEQKEKELKLLKKDVEEGDNKYKSISQEMRNHIIEKENLTKELEKSRKEKTTMEKSLRELRTQVDNTKKEKDNENKLRKEKEDEAKRLEEEVSMIKKMLKEETEKHSETLQQLEGIKQELKKRSVLSLEMEDYEKSVTELTQQLSAEKTKVKEMESILDTQRDICNGLKEEIALLENRVKVEEAHSSEIKEKLNLAKASQSEADMKISTLETTVSTLNLQIEEHRKNNENLSLQLAELAVEKQKLFENSKSQQECLQKQVYNLEDQISRLQENFEHKNRELNDLQTEFNSYKIRAQSVLRQKTKVDEPSTFTREELLAEASHLRQTVDALRSQLEDMGSQLKSITLQLNVVQEEKARLIQQSQDLSLSLNSLKEQHRLLQEKERANQAEYHENMRSQKIQHDTLTNCYKQQIHDLEERLQLETSALRLQLDAVLEDLRVSNESQTVMNKFSLQRTLEDRGGDISLLEREDGEGSESMELVSPNLVSTAERKQTIIPLEKLLSGDDDSGRMSPTSELLHIKDLLKTSECRITHLSSLLSESEHDVAKLTQQNNLLKEEIRRHERSVEREQHAQNFEYLKNVVLKFVTLHGGDERSRLVPVLSTILKLSPEEINELNQVAKGADPHSSGRSWGSYLPMWPSTT